MTYKIAEKSDIETLIDIRLEMLKVVNSLPDEYEFDSNFVKSSRNYFLADNSTTILALDETGVNGCATLCYINMMPTFDHPTGKRAHLMNVYTNEKCRRKGIAAAMVNMLIDEAKSRGVTEISLDATEMGRPLYKKLGFTASNEAMTLCLTERN